MIILGLHVDNPPPAYVYQALDPSMGGKAVVIAPLARFLRAYQLDGGYTPAPCTWSRRSAWPARHTAAAAAPGPG